MVLVMLLLFPPFPKKKNIKENWFDFENLHQSTLCLILNLGIYCPFTEIIHNLYDDGYDQCIGRLPEVFISYDFFEIVFKQNN